MCSRLQTFWEHIQERDEDAIALTHDWDAWKVDVRMAALRIIKQRRKAARNTYKQKLRRLIRQDRRLREAAAARPPTIDFITDSLDAMSLTDGVGGTPLARVRHAITACIGRCSAKQQRLFREGGHRTGKTTKQFFQRVSTKYANNDVHRLDAANGQAARGVHDKPDTRADAWTPIFQQAASTPEARSRVLQWLGDEGQYKATLQDLSAPFTEAEVAAAIGSTKARKACGPDRLGNDWYRDFAEQLIPILTRLYNAWYPDGVFPSTFLEADIFCLKKGGESSNPLNFRPLALLDTDYKILTRILATRTSSKLHWIIHPNQNGFVPHRTIHATVDLFTAAQQAAMTDPVMAAALALLLDFRKAYDSVDREFLYASLLWLGFPTSYVNAMRGMHEGTRVRFLANGYRSRWVAVTCGIRQGCPLAPLLFLFVLEALYRRIDQEPKLSGILRSAAGSVRLKVGGYADDTASYVSTIAEVILVMTITRIFASASGLRLNEKTLVIALNPETIQKMGPLPAPLRLQAITKLSRYLGLQVGSVQDPDYTWQVARTQLVARLALATRKTLTVDQRSLIAMAIVIPKLLYIGRHQWPSKGTIQAFQKMIKNYIWHGRFTECDVGGRAWLNQHVATLPRQQGGLPVPDLKMELLALAAVTVNNWAVDSDPDTQILGDVLAGCQTVGVAP
ncbi:hypothetical protein PR003_g28115 [Phytophthora rubi]|uniref:Reverse transcriptase domain-containing protein n=1 Tax=Phytophthora rubi TaxID=129364 RepID=A0A6A4BT81_9STRA|nr:hypothetical protein PR003_g28115 [Phytophthora rubi]